MCADLIMGFLNAVEANCEHPEDRAVGPEIFRSVAELQRDLRRADPALEHDGGFGEIACCKEPCSEFFK